MGERKRLTADRRKEEQKNIAFAKLNQPPPSPPKMRLVAALVRGKQAVRALGILKFNNKEAAARLEKLVRSAVANWEQKNERKAEEGELYISTIYVNCAPMLKRLRTAPQGRGYRIRKRANHVTVIVDQIDNKDNKVNSTEA